MLLFFIPEIWCLSCSLFKTPPPVSRSRSRSLSKTAATSAAQSCELPASPQMAPASLPLCSPGSCSAKASLSETFTTGAQSTQTTPVRTLLANIAQEQVSQPEKGSSTSRRSIAFGADFDSVPRGNSPFKGHAAGIQSETNVKAESHSSDLSDDEAGEPVPCQLSVRKSASFNDWLNTIVANVMGAPSKPTALDNVAAAIHQCNDPDADFLLAPSDKPVTVSLRTGPTLLEILTASLEAYQPR